MGYYPNKPSALPRNEAGPQCESHQGRNIMDMQAIHQLYAMVFDGLGTDFQDVADLFGVLTFSDELEDFALTPR